MAFVTAADIVTRIGNATAVQLTTDSGSVVDTALIDAIIAEVEPNVLAALRKRTSETITQADYPQTWSMVVGKVVDMVIFKLASRRPPVAEARTVAYRHAVEWLTKLTAGEIALPDVAANAPDPTYGFVRDDAGPEVMI